MQIIFGNINRAENGGTKQLKIAFEFAKQLQCGLRCGLIIQYLNKVV